jgi:hypothetical protein
VGVVCVIDVVVVGGGGGGGAVDGSQIGPAWSLATVGRR